MWTKVWLMGAWVWFSLNPDVEPLEEQPVTWSK